MRGLGETAGPLGERVDRARTERGAGSAEVGVAELELERIGGVDPRAEVAADEEGRNAFGEATGPLDELGEREAEGDLVDAGPPDCSAERDEGRAGLLPRAQLAAM